MSTLAATCGHEDMLGYFTNTPCKPCIIARAKKDGLTPVTTSRP